MAGNSFGTQFRFTTFGESHGSQVGCIVDGVPAGLSLSEADIQPDLDRRKPGTSKFVRQKKSRGQSKQAWPIPSNPRQFKKASRVKHIRATLPCTEKPLMEEPISTRTTKTYQKTSNSNKK